MTLEELRSRLIEVCKGKEKFVEALEMIAEQEMYIGEDRFNKNAVEEVSMLIHCGGVSCSECPFDEDSVNCNLEVDTREAGTYEELRGWYSETLRLAIASCKGEEVEVEVKEATPADNPSKPLFIVTKVDDLIGLESEDGKFEIKDSFDSCIEYVVVGKSTDYTYFDFLKKDAFNGEVLACLEELGFRFTIQERKSYLDLLEECEEVEFEVTGNSNYYIGRDLESGVVRIGGVKDWFIPGVKYISGEDADRIVKECVENA